jgi:hypothetical protein
VHEEHVIGAERAIDEQLAAPMSVRMLLAEKILLRARDRVADLDAAGVKAGAVSGVALGAG